MNNGILVRNPFHPSLFLHWRSKASSQDSSVGIWRDGMGKTAATRLELSLFHYFLYTKNDRKNKVWKNIDSSPEIGQNWSKLVKTFAKIGEEMVNMVKNGQNWSKNWSKLVKKVAKKVVKKLIKTLVKIGQTHWSELAKIG